MVLKRHIFILAAIVSVMVFQGCETIKGAKKDVANTGRNIEKIPQKIQKADAWTREHMW